MADRKRYAGKLGERLPRCRARSLAGAPPWADWDAFDDPRALDQEEWEREWRARLSLLFEHYGIDEGEPGAWRLLAPALATEHVPGLRKEKRVGRSPTRKGVEGVTARRELLALCDAKKTVNPAPSDAEICEGLTRKGAQQSLPASLRGKKARTLRSQLALARDEARVASERKPTDWAAFRAYAGRLVLAGRIRGG